MANYAMDILVHIVLIFGIGLASLQISSASTTDASSNSAEVANEVARNSIKVTLYSYRVSLSKWNTISPGFSTVVLEETNKYCRANGAKCGLSTGWESAGSFQSVQYVSADDSTKNKLIVTFYVLLPFISTSYLTITQYVLTIDALQVIITASRDRLNDLTDGAVLGIGNVDYTPPPDGFMNEVMIAIAVVLLIIVCALALIGHFYNKKMEKEENLKTKTTKKESSSKVCPSPEPEVGMPPVESQVDVKQENGKVSPRGVVQFLCRGRQEPGPRLNIKTVISRNGVFPVDSSSPLHNDVIKPLEKPHLKVALDSDQGDKINGNDVPLSPAKQLPPLFHDTEEAPKRRRRHKKKFLKRDLGQNAGSNISSPPESETPISESAPHEGDCDDMGAQGEMPSVTEL